MHRREPRVALIHDWLTGMRGGEKVLEAFCRLWPDAEIHTLLAQPEKLSALLRSKRMHTSVLNALPGISRFYRQLLPLMPAALATMRGPDVDVILSCHHCVVKSIPHAGSIPHICYCNTPMRYAWHMREAYVANMKPSLQPLVRFLLDRLRDWDRRTAHRVTHYLANSENVRRRIQDAYGRDATVVYPPVDVEFYQPARAKREDYYLVVSALVPYKRVDLAVAACKELDRPLVVIGTGEELNKLKALAGPRTTFAGWQSSEMIRDHLQRCRALLFPGEEDFGIVPLEASACGAPVICLGKGGATETVVDLHQASGGQATGVWFAEETLEGLVSAMQVVEKRHREFDPAACRRQAERFSTARFERQMHDVVHQVWRGQAPRLEESKLVVRPNRLAA